MRLMASLLLTLLLFLSTACRNESTQSSPTIERNPIKSSNSTGDPQSNATGGSDVGGGNSGESSEQEILAAIERSFQIAKDPRWTEYLKANTKTSYFWGDHISDKEMPYKIILGILDPKADTLLRLSAYWCIGFNDTEDCANSREEIRREAEEVDDPTYIDRVYKNKYLKFDGYCPAFDKDNAEASVEKGNKEGRICFSVFGLKRIPPDSIERHVLGLLFHELAHMSSEDEDSAKKVQKVAIEAYKFFMSDQILPLTTIIRDDLFDFGIQKLKWSVLGVNAYIGEQPNFEEINRKKVLLDLLVELGRQKQIAFQMLAYIEHFPREACDGINMPIIEGSISVESSFLNFISNVESVIEKVSVYIGNPSLDIVLIFEEVERLYESAGILYPCLDPVQETEVK